MVTKILTSLFLIFFIAFGWLISVQMPSKASLFSLFFTSENLDLLLIQSYTFPRITIALLAGGLLGLASLLLQQVMSNPLASDNTLGISAGSQFALFLTAIFMPQWLEYGSSLIALLGSVLSLLLVIGLALRKTLSPLLLILAGLVVNLYFGSFSALMMLFYPEESRGLALWGAGSLVQESWWDSQLLALQAVIPLGIIAIFSRPFNLLSLNENNAQSLGVPVIKLRFLGVLLSAFLIAIVVSKVGMVGFIGLSAATLTRQLHVHHFKHQLLSAFFFGGLLLAITDLGLQLLIHYYQLSLPTGAVTALLGTPLLLWLMLRSLTHTGQLAEPARPTTTHFTSNKTYALCVLGIMSILTALLLNKSINGWEWTISPELLSLRLPRLFIALAVGILLAIAGVILQQLTLNPMASPELLGVSSGTSIGILIVLFGFNPENQTLFWLFGILGAFIALLIIMAINQHNGMLPEKVLLTGISLSALFDSLQRLAIASGDLRALQLITWTSGSTQYAQISFAILFLIIACILLTISLIFSRWLTLFTLQAPTAQALGLNLKRSRFILISFSALLTALATLIIGPLSFIGLLVPQISRFLGVRHARLHLLISALIGGLIMIFADFIGRQLLFPYEIPAGLVATLIGGSYFLFMIRKI